MLKTHKTQTKKQIINKIDTCYNIRKYVTGAKHGRRATWIGASGDQTFLRIDESLISAYTLAKSNIFANNSCIGKLKTIS